MHDKQAQYGDKQISVIAGDNIGASPLVDGLFFGEPSTIVTNLMNADFASVGNHEFDKGSTELLRIQNGGCRADDGCTAAPYALAGGGTTNTYPGADFQYLSANVVRNDNRADAVPRIRHQADQGRQRQEVHVGVIGEVLEATPTIVTPAGVAGLTFQDEADAANRAVAAAQAQGREHQRARDPPGRFPAGHRRLNGCAGNLAGSDIAEIASTARPGHQGHRVGPHACRVPVHDHHPDGVTRLITSASSFGRILTDITLTIDDKYRRAGGRQRRQLDRRNGRATPRTTGDVPLLDTAQGDQRVADVVAAVRHRLGAAGQPDHRQGHRRHHPNALNPLGEITLGDVIADAQLVATQPANLGGAQVAFMNPGGIRGDCSPTASPPAPRRPARSPTARRSRSSRSATASSPRR